MSNTITTDMMLEAYAMGIFPMADDATSSEIYWYDPPARTLMPLDSRFHIPRRLMRTIRSAPYEITVNKAFKEVIKGCSQPAKGREVTWINQKIFDLYAELHMKRYAQSIEAWDGDELVGGLYGVSLGGAFFGESMFSRKKDASKIALVKLVSMLRCNEYKLLDCQFMTPHLAKFGAYEVSREEYLCLLDAAIKQSPVGLA